MSSRKLVLSLFVGLVALLFFKTPYSRPLKNTFYSKLNRHNHYALTLHVLDIDSGLQANDTFVHALSEAEIKVIPSGKVPGAFYISRKSSWHEQKWKPINFVVSGKDMNPKLVTISVGFDCDSDHHAERIETVSLTHKTDSDYPKFTLEELKVKWKQEGGASLLVDALERNTIDTGLARILSEAKKSDTLQNVLVLFNNDTTRSLAQTKKKARLAQPGFNVLIPRKAEEIVGVPAVIMNGTAEEILLLSNLPDVHFMAKID